MGDVEHVPDRPSWDCRACGEQWPCAPAQGALLVEFAGFLSVLRIYMSAQLGSAVDEIPEPVPVDLYDRFMAWTR